MRQPDPIFLARLAAEFLEERKADLLAFCKRKNASGHAKVADAIIEREKKNAAALETLEALKLKNGENNRGRR